MRTTRDNDGGDARLSAQLLVRATARLEKLVARLSLEPGIHAVHWHTVDDPDPPLARGAEDPISGSPDH